MARGGIGHNKLLSIRCSNTNNSEPDDVQTRNVFIKLLGALEWWNEQLLIGSAKHANVGYI